MTLLNLFRRKLKVGRHKPAAVAAPVGPASDQGPGPPLVVRTFGLSDRGQVRPSNEDRFAIVEPARALYGHQAERPQPATRFGGQREHVFLVADGMGGHEAGAVASALAVEAIEEFLRDAHQRPCNGQGSDAQNALKELEGALLQAEARIFAEAASHPEWRGMGTTVTLAFAMNRMLFIAHGGDSRCYLLSRGGLRRLTLDHTFAAECVRQGILAPASEARHPYRHVVTNLLGGSTPGVKVELHRHDLHPDDVLLLCSDALTDMVSDDRIAAVLREEPDPQRACERLVVEANRHGGKDNITVVVARVEEPGRQTLAAGCSCLPNQGGGGTRVVQPTAQHQLGLALEEVQDGGHRGGVFGQLLAPGEAE
jgi:protein phosphatase